MSDVAEKNLDLKIEGMSCGHCVDRVRNALAGTPGVLDASVDLEAGRAAIRVTGGADPAQLVSAVEKAGYTAQAL